jgi:hypothetical protein
VCCEAVKVATIAIVVVVVAVRVAFSIERVDDEIEAIRRGDGGGGKERSEGRATRCVSP